MTDTENGFEGWAIVELMGHRRLGAWVSEVEIAGAAMLRLDVPTHPWQDGCTCGSDEPSNTDHEAHQSHCYMFRAPGEDKPVDVYATQFYATSALYCLTPTTEEMARAVRSRPEPVTAWELPRPQLPAAPEPEYVPRVPFNEEDDEEEVLMAEQPQASPPPLWAVALDKMRDYYGQPLVSQVTLTAAEAFAFMEHYLTTSADLERLRFGLVNLRETVDLFVADDVGMPELGDAMDKAYAALYPPKAVTL